MSFFQNLLSGQAGGGPRPEKFFEMYGWEYGKPLVKRHELVIVSGYGAKFKRKVKIDQELETMVKEMSLLVNDSKSERLFVLDVIALFEREAAKQLGLKDDAGLSFSGSGDSKQTDCVDEAWNSTVVLLWLEKQEYLKYHIVREPLTKWALWKWNHYAAIIEDNETRVKYAIDSGVRNQGGLASITEASRWYE